MTQAGSVHSTPPTNTSALPAEPTRRRFLTIAAFGSMVGAGTLAAAALTPNDVSQAVTIPPMYSAAQLAKTYELPEAQNHPQTDEDGRMALVAHWRGRRSTSY